MGTGETRNKPKRTNTTGRRDIFISSMSSVLPCLRLPWALVGQVKVLLQVHPPLSFFTASITVNTFVATYKML